MNIDIQIDLIAVYAAIVATGVLIWDFVKWRQSRARLSVSTSSSMKILGGEPNPRTDGKTFVSVTVTNVGGLPTTITNFGMQYYRNQYQLLRRRPSKQFIIPQPGEIAGFSMPQKLPPGEQLMGMIEQTADVEKMAVDGLLYATVYHAVGRKPVTARIRIKRNQSEDEE